MAFNNNTKTPQKIQCRNPIDLAWAQKIINQEFSPLSPLNINTESALGLVLADDVFSAISQPPYPRSPYDGYALKAEDSIKADQVHPVKLKVIGTSYAGIPMAGVVQKGQAVRIMTGGCIPEGADCVIMQEKTDRGIEEVHIKEKLSPYDNYCFIGEDFKQGKLMMKKGEKISPAAMAVASSAGMDTLYCIPKPVVALISTGMELQSPGTPLSYGQIYDANTPYLKGRLQELGVQTITSFHAEDRINDIVKIMEQALNSSDIIITSGGVSVGEHDLIPHSLAQLQAEILFHGIKMKPGMPSLLAKVQNKPMIGLSGNPFAAAVGFEMLVRPALSQLAGDAALLSKPVKAVLKNEYPKESKNKRFLRGKLADGSVYIPDAQGNEQMLSMIGCNCLIEIPEGSSKIPENTEVMVYPF